MCDSNEISKEVKQFIFDNIDTFGQLEVLLLLFRHPNRDWTPEQVSTELRSSTAATIQQLRHLAVRKIAKQTEDSVFRFGTEFSHLSDIVKKLEQAYSVRRIRVIGLIYDKTDAKIRALADAFRIKKEDN